MTKFFNKDKSISRYGLSCGYIETYSNEQSTVKLYQDGGPCYHIKVWDGEGQRVIWVTVDYLTEARKIFNQWKRKVKKGELLCRSQ